mmetsp:Transcript_49215/g.97004  ORF Transcript_49215/g.97004 Transcript_49215/m.97004 type:complete len:221 (-) Transcript_49215:131-793(-)
MDLLGVVSAPVLFVSLLHQICQPTAPRLPALLPPFPVSISHIVHICKNGLRVKELRVQLLRGLEPEAHHKNLCGDVTRRLGLGGLHPFEQLTKDIQQRVVICRPENLRYKRPAGSEKLARKLHGMQDQLILRERIGGPGGPNVRRTVMQKHVSILALKLLLEKASAPPRGDVCLNGYAPFDGLDGCQIDSNYGGSQRHVLLGHLHPPSRGSAEVNKNPCI